MNKLTLVSHFLCAYDIEDRALLKLSRVAMMALRNMVIGLDMQSKQYFDVESSMIGHIQNQNYKPDILLADGPGVAVIYGSTFLPLVS